MPDFITAQIEKRVHPSTWHWFKAGALVTENHGAKAIESAIRIAFPEFPSLRFIVIVIVVTVVVTILMVTFATAAPVEIQ